MSHADDGTLHAYLDGELSPVERSRLESHFGECASCRDRLAEERSLIERADRLLTLAAPPEGHVNRPVPLPRRRRYFVPGVWAASIAAAFLAGWMLRPGGPGTVAQVRNEAGPVVAYAPPSAPAPTSPPVDTPRRMARAAGAPLAAADRPERAQESRKDSSAEVAAATGGATADQIARQAPVPGVVGSAAAPTLRGAPPTPVPAAKVAITPPSALARREVAAQATLGTTWTVIAAEPARRVLGTDVVRIPGLPIRDILQNPLVPGALLVEQEVAAGTVIQLLQSQAAAPDLMDSVRPSLRYSGEETLRRTVGSVQVRISGPLSTDSLLKLLQLAR